MLKGSPPSGWDWVYAGNGRRRHAKRRGDAAPRGCRVLPSQRHPSRLLSAEDRVALGAVTLWVLCAVTIRGAALRSRFHVGQLPLLVAGSDAGEQDKYGDTPLHWAVSNENPAIGLTLLHAGADPMVRGRHGLTRLHLAASHENPEVLQALLTTGADPMARDKDSETHLHVAGGSTARIRPY